MIEAIGDFLRRLFDPSGFPARWKCGEWSSFEGWLLIGSDLAIFAAYFAIPVSILIYLKAKRREVVFPRLYWLFAAFILLCGLTHLIDAVIFWQPLYRLSGFVKFNTALVSWAAVFVLVRSLGPALDLPGAARLNAQLTKEVGEHQRSEAALRQTSTRLSLALQHAKLGDWCWFPETDIVEFSPRGYEIFGLTSPAPITWTSLRDHIHEQDRENVRLAVEAAVSGRQEYNVEYRVIRECDGQLAWIRAKGFAEYDAANAVVRMLGIVEDVTEWKLAETERGRLLEAAQSARSDAEAANREKDEFLAILSHELRTPLNAILNWSHLLKTQTQESNVTEGLVVIERNALAQSRLVEDLLDMNRVVNGKLRLDVQRVDLSRVIQAAIDAVKPSADSKNLRLVAVLDPIAGPVKGDPARLQQAIWNLLTNAIKFTSDGGRIQVSLERVNSHVEISVSDNGIGIAPDLLPHVFERFRQADSSTTRTQGGLGLGLNIVKNLIELHGGSVHAKSEGRGAGATFRIALPLLPTASDADADKERAHPASSTHTDLPAPDPTVLRGSDILIVEDDPDSLLALRKILEKQGASVRACATADEALSALQEHHYHAFVSDIGLPRMDGYALMQQVRAMPNSHSNQQVPSIALTAFSRSEDRQRAMLSGFDIFLSKPVNPAELLAAVERCLIRAGR